MKRFIQGFLGIILIFLFVHFFFLQVKKDHNASRKEVMGIVQIKKPSHLYVMYCDELNLYKIGLSIDPDRRLKEIQREVSCVTGGTVSLLRVYKEMGSFEPKLHEEFRDKQTDVQYCDSVSPEWFRLTSMDLIEFERSMWRKQKRYYGIN